VYTRHDHFFGITHSFVWKSQVSKNKASKRTEICVCERESRRIPTVRVSLLYPVFWLVDADLLREKNTAEWLADKHEQTGCLCLWFVKQWNILQVFIPATFFKFLCAKNRTLPRDFSVLCSAFVVSFLEPRTLYSSPLYWSKSDRHQIHRHWDTHT
jgi:hypothetical protein